MFEQTLNGSSDFLPVDTFHILINFLVNHFHCCLKSFNSLFQLFKFLHHIFYFDINNCLNKFSLSLLQSFSVVSFMLKTGFYSGSLILLDLNFFLLLDFIFYNICNNFFFNFVFSKCRFKHFGMIKLYDLYFFFLFVKYINDRSSLLINFFRQEIIYLLLFLFVCEI